MALSATNRVRTFEVFGLPPEGSDQTIVTTLAHLPVTQLQTWEPTFSHSNISNIRASIDANLAAISAETQARIEMFLEQWEIIVISPMSISKADNGVEGRIVDNEEQREIIRQRIGNLVGVWVPRGGWMREIGTLFTPNSYPHNNAGGRY